MKKYITLILISVGICLFGQIGISKSGGDNNWRIGGDLGVSFGGNSYFGFNVSPFVGYRITPNFEAGLTTGYQLTSSNYAKSNLFNVGPYINFYPTRSVFLRANFEYYTGNIDYKSSILSKKSIDESTLWVGGGYASPGPVSFHTGIMYNVLFKDGQSIFYNGFRPYAGISVSL